MINQERKSLRAGALVIAGVILLRLGANGFFQPVMKMLGSRELASFLMYMQTGTITRIYEPPGTEPVFAGESAAPDLITQEPEEIPVILPSDLDLVSFYSSLSLPDLEPLLHEPLNWDLKTGEPKVLILHTHGTECYTQTEGEQYSQLLNTRTLDTNYNMVSIGARLARRLEEAGIGVIHDTRLHDAASYNGAYDASREAARQILAENPSIELVLDLHRDAADTATGQLQTFASVGDVESTQLMLVVGSDAGGLTHPDWRKNLALALKLQIVLEKENPGICRDISFRAQRFNQDLSPGSLLVEVGAAGDTHERALAAADVLAQGIIALAEGVVTENSTG